jgi:ubiquinone/menaquinone biosynthesis C-methylase UbiE
MEEATERSKRLVTDRFARAAEGYVRHTILAEGDELDAMVELAALTGTERVLDIATGGGHTALAFAPHAAEVVATDLTPEMLDAARGFAVERGATNVRFEVADAEALPFADETFDVATARFAPHHFPHPERFCAEVRRVLRPGGRFVMFDNMAPEDDELDAFVNRFERWRDPGHERARRLSEWRGMLEAAGMRVAPSPPLSRKRYDYDEWTARMHVPAAEKDALARWLLQAPRRCAEYFRVTADGDRVTSLEATFGLIAAVR